jgi:integrase
MSVRKRTWTTKSGEQHEAYLVQYSTPELDARGKRTRHVKSFDRKKDAQAFEAQVRVDVAKGVHVPASRSKTIGEAGANWIASCGDLEPMTIDGYRQHLNLHIAPFIGAVKLAAITVATVRNWQDQLRKAGRSRDMVRRVTTSLGSLLADAVERGDAGTNVVRSLKANRKRGKERQAERRAKGRLKVGRDIPTPAEINALLAVATGKWRPFLLIAIRCGLRASELRGLRWRDVEKGVLHVRQRADARNTIGAPKSEASERSIPIPPATLQALATWRKECPKGELVFPGANGEPDSYDKIMRALAPTFAAAEWKYPGLHGLRHYFASWCINRPPIGLGLSLKEVQERMGHSNIAVTADTYSHLFERDDESAALAIAEGRFG